MLCSDVIQHSEIVLGAVVFRTSYLNIPLHLVSAWRRKVAARASVIYFAITAIGGKRSRASNDRAVRLFDVDSFTAQLRYDLLPADNRLYAVLISKELEIAHDKDIVSDGVFKKVTINAAANIKGSIDLEFSQVPDFFGGFNFFGNGVFGNKGGGEICPLIGWKWAGGTTYPLFELCARQIIHNNRVQKNKYNGEFITSISRLTRPLFNSIFNFDNKNLILNYGDYDILDEVMTAELIEVFDYDDITLNFIDTGNEWSK